MIKTATRPKTRSMTTMTDPAELRRRLRSDIVPVEDAKPPAPRASNLLTAVMSAIADPACDPGKMNALLDVRERIMREEAYVQFITAFIDLRQDLPSIRRDGKLDQGTTKTGKLGAKSRYATYENINKVTTPILSKHRFAILMLPDVGKDGVGVLMRAKLAYVCDTEYGRIVHAEYCAIAAPIEASGGKNNVQGVGSSLSYTKRYAVVNLLNLVSEAPEDRDDDGRAAGRRRRPDDAGTEDAVVLITKTQANKLQNAIDDCGIALARFCEKYQVDDISNLPVSLYDDAIAACAAFKAEKLKKQKDAPNG